MVNRKISKRELNEAVQEAVPVLIGVLNENLRRVKNPIVRETMRYYFLDKLEIVNTRHEWDELVESIHRIGMQ